MWTWINYFESLLLYSFQLILWWRWTLMTFCTKNCCLLSSIKLACQCSPDRWRDKSFCMGNASRKTSSQKIRACRLSTTWPTSLWCLGSNVLQVHNRQMKAIFCFQWINMPVKLHFFNYLREPSQLLNPQLFSQEIWRSYVKLSPLQAIKMQNKNINFWLSYWEFARGFVFLTHSV